MAETTFTIDPFRPGVDDPAEIARLHLEVREGQVRAYHNVFSNILESQVDLSTIGAFYVEPGGNFFIAHDTTTEQVAGFVGVKREDEGVGSIKRMAVLEAFRHRGIGLALAQTAVKWSADKGYSKLRLGTGIKEHAKPIYEAVGFVVVGMKKGKDGQYKDYLMELDLVQAESSV